MEEEKKPASRMVSIETASLDVYAKYVLRSICQQVSTPDPVRSFSHEMTPLLAEFQPQQTSQSPFGGERRQVSVSYMHGLLHAHDGGR